MPEFIASEHTVADLEQAADSLLESFHLGEDDAIDRVRQYLPQARQLEGEAADFPLTLAGAQTVIAREYGKKSWGELCLAIKLEHLDYGEALQQFKGLIYKSDAKALDELLSAQPKLRDTLDDPHFDFGSTALIIAKQNLGVVDVLLKHGADINAKSQWWAGDFHILEGASAETAAALGERGAQTTVHAAAEQGWIDWLEQAYQGDKSIARLRGGDDKTPLHYASDEAVMDWLLERGADLEARDLDHQSTPLQWKIGEHDYDAARALIKRGAQVDVFAAVALGELDLVQQALTERPHAIRARVNQDGYELTPRADGSHQYVYAFSGAGMSPHQVALEYGHEQIFDYLPGQSPLDAQLLAYCAQGNSAAAGRIAAEHPQLVSQLSDANQRQLLHAAWTGKTEVVKLMTSLGFDLHVLDDDKLTPLHWAAFHGYRETAAVLLDADPEPPLDWINGYGGTPLTTCMFGHRHGWRSGGDHAACLRLLAKAGSEVKAEWLPTGDDVVDEALRAILKEREQ